MAADVQAAITTNEKSSTLFVFINANYTTSEEFAEAKNIGLAFGSFGIFTCLKYVMAV
jgi:hypothetical protein